MILDLKRLLADRKGTADGQFEADYSGESFPAGFFLKKPVSASWSAARTGSSVSLELHIHCEAEITCDRCLTKTDRDYDFDADYLFAPRDWENEDCDYPITVNGHLDLTELVYQEILLNLPTSLLCRPDCEGLCPVCGRPVSDGCSCQREAPVDERLSILKQLLT